MITLPFLAETNATIEDVTSIIKAATPSGKTIFDAPATEFPLILACVREYESDGESNAQAWKNVTTDAMWDDDDDAIIAKRQARRMRRLGMEYWTS